MLPRPVFSVRAINGREIRRLTDASGRSRPATGRSGGSSHKKSGLQPAFLCPLEATYFCSAGAAAGAAESARLLRQAADEEDAVEKLPVTPGPIVPAREQLGELLLQQNQPQQALREFSTALVLAPGRRGALLGGAEAAERIGDTKTAAQMRATL